MTTFGLADRLGMTRADLLDSIDSEELTGWMAYDRVRGPTPLEYLLATICAILAQTAGDKRAKRKDFLPWLTGWKEANRGGSTVLFKRGRKNPEGD